LALSEAGASCAADEATTKKPSRKTPIRLGIGTGLIRFRVLGSDG
jgi:hypothetical protein